MDLRHLEHFVAVAQERHFTRAARRLNIVQSGLSASIRALEGELGTSLFQRSTRRVDLTAAGRVLLTEAQRVLHAAREAKAAVAQVEGLQRGRLAIGSIQSLAPFLDLPASLGRFHAAFPGVEIRLSLGSSAALVEQVREGQLDLAFTQYFGPLPNDLCVRMLACEALVLACAPSHGLAGRRNLPLGGIAGEVFIDLSQDWGLRRQIDQSFRDAGLARRTGFEVNDVSMQLDLVARGLGVALVPEAVVTARAAEGRHAPVAHAELAEEICWELAMIFASSEGGRPAAAAARAMVEMLALPEWPAVDA
jgi:DNA-binding transcriptional LysR family regulator